MNKDINQNFLIGRLCNDPVLKQTSSGLSICNFSIANNQGTKEKPEVNFFDTVVFGTMADVCNKCLTKGSQVAITGRLKQERWTDKTSGQNRSKIVIIAENVQFIGGKKDGADADPWKE